MSERMRVPAERELRDKLRHLTSDPGPLGSAVCALLKAAAAGFPVMVMPDESSAILDLLAPQGAREPDGWAIRMRDGSWRSTVYEDPETAERKAAKAREFFAARGNEDDEFDSIDVLPVYLGAPAKATTCPCGGGPGHGDAWCGDYECPTCGRGPKQEEAIFQAGLERGRAAPAPAEATEASAPDGATWGDVRSGLRAELIAEGMPVTEATRLARKVVHRFTAAEATERSEPSGPYRLTGAAIRNRRTAAGMSLRELAAAVGISNVELGEIERGIRRPGEKTVTAIRNAIDAARCGLPSPVRGYGPCILRRGHSGPGAHQHGETGRILQAYHAPDTSEEGAGDADAE